MVDPNEREPEPERREYRPQTLEWLEKLREDPTTPVNCVHNHVEGAVGIYEVPGGCVAWPGVEVQPLCQHHRNSDGSFEGMIPVIDLSINGGWAKAYGDEFDFYSVRDEETGEISIVEAAAFLGSPPEQP
jgi:hypothetical protein